MGGNLVGDELDDVVNFVAEIATGVKEGATFTAVTLNTPEIKAATTYQGLTDAINAALDATAFGTDLEATLQADGVTIFIEDTQGRELADTTTEVPGAGVTVNQKANTQTENVFNYGEPPKTLVEDRIIYQAYEDRADGEKVDDQTVTGSTISLGTDAYAEDLVIDFITKDGKVSTFLAEDQSYALTFTNLTTEDNVKLTVNGVIYQLTVGVDLDGNEIANEELTNQGGNAANQVEIQSNFLIRMRDFINSFMDDDTSAGKVTATDNFILDTAPAGGNQTQFATTLTLTQANYNVEETVFMRTPTVVITNASGGEPATVVGLNNSQHEVELFQFDGSNNELNASNVLFLGDQGINRATLETALTAGDTIVGSEAMVVDGGADTLENTKNAASSVLAADNTATNSFLRTDFTVHGDDLLLGAAGNDSITAGTGDDRVLGSLSKDLTVGDIIDGGKSFYAVKVLGEAQARVYTLNQWEATNPTLVTALKDLTISSINRIDDAESGNATPASAGLAEVFNDTLQFQQKDFAAKTKFTVVLDGFTGTTAATVAFPNAGAGQVLVDDAGDGTDNGLTKFTNFENIRTVSGTSNAVADDGQGDDTLDVSALSNAAGGVSYDLTNTNANVAGLPGAGDVRYSANAQLNQLAYNAGATAVAVPGATAASVKAAIIAANTTVEFANAVNALPVTGTAAAYLASVGALTLLTRPTSVLDPLDGGPNASDYETLVIKVDGIENVIGGSGKDLLMIDESEAAKDNMFKAGSGNDRIEYLNDFSTAAEVAVRAAAVALTTTINTSDPIATSGAYLVNQTLGNANAYLAAANALVPAVGLTAADVAAHKAAAAAAVAAEAALFSSQVTAEPTVTIKLDNVAALVDRNNETGGTDTVIMTSGRVGATVAEDKLIAVERISVLGNTAEGKAEADVIDVTAMTSGAVVDYITGEVRTGLAVGTGVHVVIEGIVEFENVWADGNDTVIVDDAANMGKNTRSDELVDNLLLPESVAENIGLGTFYDFDELNTAGTGRRSFAEQVTGGTATQVINPNQFTFDLSKVGTDTDVDTIDYSHELGKIVAVMNFVASDTAKYVVVDGDSDDVLIDAQSRIDKLVSVERIVAASGADSTVDLTNSDRNVNVVFSYNQPNNKTNFFEGKEKIAALDLQINTVRVSDAANQTALGNVDLLEYRDLGDLNTGATAITQTQAVWESVQGSDFREYVELTQWEDDINHVFNLRGGQNEVNYNERTNGIELVISSVNATIDGIPDQFLLFVGHLDAVGDLNGGVDTISSFATSNTFNEAAGARTDSLRIEASQGDMDLINVATVAQNGLFILGKVETSGDSVVTATFGGTDAGSGLVLSGFEGLWDMSTSDVYSIEDLTGFVSKMTLIDYGQNFNNADVFLGSDDRDTIKLGDGAFETATIRAPISHQLTVEAKLHMGDGDWNDLQWLGVNDLSWKAPLAVKEGAPDAGDRKANSVGFDFHVLDISAVKQTASGGSLANQITAAGSAISADDELVVGNLSLLNKDIPQAITNFDILSLTGAGASYDFDRTAGELQTAANVKIVGFDADMETLDVSRTTSGNTITVSGGAARVVGSAHNDTLTGGAGNDSVFGGNGDDLIAGGGVQIDNVYTVNFNQLAASTAGQTITAFGVTKTYAASGDDVNTLGILFAATSAASFSDGSGNVAKAVSYDAAANTLRVTFGLDVSANVSPADVASSAATVTLVTNPVPATAFAAPGAGNDVLRGGAGKDTVDGGAGTDTIVVVGSVDTAQAAAYRGNAALNTQGEVDVMVGAFAVNMVTDLQTVHITTDVASGDSYNGGAGVDTLHIFGAADMTTTTITNVEVIDIHSAVTFTAAQLDAMLVLNIDDGAEITVTGLALGQTPMQALQSVSRVNFPNGVYKLNGEIYGTGVEVATVTLNTGALNANETLTLTGPGGTLVVSASGGPGEFKTASVSGTAAQVGALLAGLPTSVLETELGYAPGRIAATAYNSTTNVFTLAFTVAAGNCHYSAWHYPPCHWLGWFSSRPDQRQRGSCCFDRTPVAQ